MIRPKTEKWFGDHTLLVQATSAQVRSVPDRHGREKTHGGGPDSISFSPDHDHP